jgi:UDP-N-acetylglucosamine:LPS N-acetylglucosamine transferase
MFTNSVQFIVSILFFVSAVFMHGCGMNNAATYSHKLLEQELGVKITDSGLITKDGREFKKIRWLYPFHKDLRLALKDLEIEKIVLEKFDRIFDDFNSYETVIKNIIGDWIIKNVKFIGHEIDQQTDDYVLNDFRVGMLDARYRIKIREFYQDISNTLRDKFKRSSTLGTNIAVLASAEGGGHLAVAKAIESLLKSKQAYNVFVINERDQEADFDAIAIASGQSLSFTSVYNEIYQKKGQVKRAQQIWQAAQDVLTDYIPLDLSGAVRRAVIKTQPSVIINTIAHRNEYVGISYYNNIPQLVFFTDYNIPTSSTETVQKVTSRLINYLTPTDNFVFLKGFYERFNGTNGTVGSFHKNTRGQLLIDSFDRRKLDINFINRNGAVFKIQGIPVRMSFDRSNFSDQKIIEIRDSLGIENGFHPVMISFGSTGGETTMQIIKFFIENSDKITHPIHLISIAGNNLELNDEIQNLGFKGNNKLRLTTKLFLEEKELAEIFAVSKVLLGKPGGGTATECYHMKVPLIALDYNPWELANIDFLKIFNLGYLIEKPDWNSKLLRQIKELIEGGAVPHYNPLDWKSNFIRNLEDFFIY